MVTPATDDESDNLFLLPPEAREQPTPLIGLSGLNITHNATHLLLWHTFSRERQRDRLPLRYLHAAPKREFPRKKHSQQQQTKRSSDIVKTAWLRKYLDALPAVIAHVVEWPDEDAHGSERRIEIASQLASLRSSLGAGRSTRFCIVLLVQQQNSLDSERLGSIAHSAELPTKNLFLLRADHDEKQVLASIRRIESSLLALADSFYSGEAKRVRAKRDQIQRLVNGSRVLVWHQIRQAFFHELRQEPAQALQLYKTAQLQLKEIRAGAGTDDMRRLLEAAMLLNYKCCRLLFSLGKTRDALEHFRVFREFYKTFSVGDVFFIDFFY